MTAVKAAVAVILAAGLAACSTPEPTALVTTTAAQTLGHTTRTTSPRTAAAPTDTWRKEATEPAAVASTELTRVDAANPYAVARAVVLATNQADTQVDSSRRDALRQAAQWLTPALLAGSLAAPHRPDADWNTLIRHHGYTTVDHLELANEYGQPPNTATRRYMQISYLLHELGRDGWRESNTGPQLDRLRLIKRGFSWEVEGFD